MQPSNLSNSQDNEINKEQESSPSLIEEGKSLVYSYLGKISKKLPVFYNPVMKDNRSLTILLLRALDRKSLRIALPLAASGVRGIRMLKELPQECIKEILFNDLNEKAISIITKNLEVNQLENEKAKVKLFNEDAKIFLLRNRPFDYIDIDPFGTPNPFLDSAISSLKNNGILAVTATDTAPLCGTYVKACIRKYWAFPLHNYLMNEIGLRILIRKVQLIGLNYEIALLPFFSYAKDHYFRVFFKATKSKSQCIDIFNKHKELVFINAEDFISKGFPTIIARKNKINNPDLFVDNILTLDEFNDLKNRLNLTGQIKAQIFGPIWTGQIFDKELVSKIIDINKKLNDLPLNKFLSILGEESKVNIVGFYDIHSLSKSFKKSPPKKSYVLSRLNEKGFFASETHFSPTAIKTDASLSELIGLLF